MARSKGARPWILVLAGVNGAGKSSVGGAMLGGHGLDWFNPDAYARELRRHLACEVAEANARAWEFGRERLESAIASGDNFAFETTLGGRTIPTMLAKASRSHDVMMLFCGLASEQQHLQRVRMRVAHGGHDIDESKIRERWVSSRVNLINLMPRLARLQVFDNSAEVAAGRPIPDPRLVLEMSAGRMLLPDARNTETLQATPRWARPLVQAAIELAG